MHSLSGAGRIVSMKSSLIISFNKYYKTSIKNQLNMILYIILKNRIPTNLLFCPISVTTFKYLNQFKTFSFFHV